MHPILFKIGTLTFYTHGLLSVLGIVLGGFILYKLAQKQKLDTSLILDNIIYSVLAGIVGARLVYFFMYRYQFSSLSEIFYLWNGGMVSYGGFFLGAIAFILLLRSQKQNVAKWLDISLIAFSIGLFLGRIGNLMAGEYSGRMSSSFLAIDGVLPVTLFEGFLLVVIFGLLLLMHAKVKNLKDGSLALIFLLLYGFGRFIIDFWRAEEIVFFNLGLGQIVSLALGVFALAVIIFNKFFNGRRNKNAIV